MTGKKSKAYNSDNSMIRQLGLFDSSMMMMGIVIGSGIFVTTGLAVAFSEYCSYFFPFISSDNIIYATTIGFGDYSFQASLTTTKVLALALIFLLSSINYLGVAFGKMVQNIIIP